MKGQWIGDRLGHPSAEVIINVDELPSHFEGVAYLNEEDPAIPSTAVLFRTQNKENDFQVRTNEILPVHPYTRLVDSWENVKIFYARDANFSNTTDIFGSWNSESLSISWATDIGVSGKSILSRSKAQLPSELLGIEKDWASYKEYVADLKGHNYLFRGQNKPWRLRTSFHRTGRADLNRFLNSDIQTLHRRLSSRTKHVFNLEIPNENGAFFNLVQHHGYPTPLLDWTYSPYVGAFFAYRGINRIDSDIPGPPGSVRILIFDQAKWKSDWIQLVHLMTASLHVSIGEFMAIENERMIPQQAASIVTNIDDIESYIESKESENRCYLSAIDLPVQDRERVMQDLRYMGITAGSMFPGLDGMCEELKERNFEI